MSARKEILARIREGNRVVTQSTSWDHLPRDYRRTALSDRDGAIKLFEERLLDYDATVTRCLPNELGRVLCNVLSSLGLGRIAAPVDFDESLVSDDFELVRDESLSYMELDRCDGVLTTSTLGIAETGTIVLQNVPGQGRRALTLVPDLHICIVKVSDVVATVPEAFQRLASTSHLPTTFISGPSATADIEMTRVKGVHGPRFLHVVLVDDEVQNQA